MRQDTTRNSHRPPRLAVLSGPTRRVYIYSVGKEHETKRDLEYLLAAELPAPKEFVADADQANNFICLINGDTGLDAALDRLEAHLAPLSDRRSTSWHERAWQMRT